MQKLNAKHILDINNADIQPAQRSFAHVIGIIMSAQLHCECLDHAKLNKSFFNEFYVAGFFPCLFLLM